MTPRRRMTIAPFGFGVRFDFDETVPDRFIDDIAEAWAGVSDDAVRVGFEHRVSLSEPAGVAGTIAQPTEDALAEHIGAALTLAAVEACKGETLSIHASAVALADGRVIAFIGRPGSGKSTLVSQAGRHEGYVTDETVAVRRSGEVLPFRKPIALHSGGGWKRHRSPDASGMLPLPTVPLRLAGLMLLARDENGPSTAVVEDVAFEEGVRALLPELSYFASLPRPLHYLADLVDSVGGIRRIRYREAETVLPLLQDVPRPGPIRGEDSRDDAVPDARAGTFARTPETEWVEREGSVVCLRRGIVETLTGVAPTIWHALARPSTAGEITDAVVDAHGAPSTHDARGRVEELLTELVRRDLVLG